MPDIFSRLPSICTRVLGEEVTWLPPLLPPVALRGIYDVPFAIADPFGDGVGISASQPKLHLKSSDATGILDGATFLIRGEAFRVMGEPQPDGMGVTTLVLQQA